MVRWLLSLVLLAGGPEKPDEPHPFPQDRLAEYQALFDRMQRGEPNLEAPTAAFLAANAGNPRAHRLMGLVLLRAGDRTRGAAELEEALRLGIGPVGRRAELLAQLGRLELESDPVRARQRIEEAIRLEPDEGNVLYAAVLLDLQSHHPHDARTRAERLVQLAPDSGDAQALLSAARWDDGDHLGAYEAVERARALGASRPYFDEIESGTRPERWGGGGLWALLACAAVLGAWLGLVALVGRALSRAELSALAEVRADLGSGTRTPREARVERVYTWVLWSAVALLLVALPALLAGTAALGVGLVWAMFLLPVLSLKLVLLVVVGTAIALWGMVRGLFVTLNGGEGRTLGRDEEPRLHTLVEEVAAAAKARPVGEIVLNPGAAIGVQERGSTLGVLLGRGTGVLHLGFAALQHLTVGELRAVLAHEYGHLSHGETQLTPVLGRVETASIAMLQGTAQGGYLAYINPAFWFLRGYVRVYLRITRGQGRRRELLADRVAALTYGGDTFARALTKVGQANHDVGRAVRVLGALRSAGIRAEGLYRLQALKRAEMLPPLRHALEEESTRAAHGEFDTHPPDAERIERVRGIEGTVPDDPAPAVSLLAGAEKMAAELAAEVLQQLPPPDESQPAPAGSVDEVSRALSRLLDAHELAAKSTEQALPHLAAAVEDLSQALGPEHPVVGEQLSELAALRRKHGDLAGADADTARAEAIAEAHRARTEPRA